MFGYFTYFMWVLSLKTIFGAKTEKEIRQRKRTGAVLRAVRVAIDK